MIYEVCYSYCSLVVVCLDVSDLIVHARSLSRLKHDVVCPRGCSQGLYSCSHSFESFPCITDGSKLFTKAKRVVSEVQYLCIKMARKYLQNSSLLHGEPTPRLQSSPHIQTDP
jgi:hypothetical protein